MMETDFGAEIVKSYRWRRWDRIVPSEATRSAFFRWRRNLPVFRIQALAQRFKVVGLYFSAESQEFRTTAHPVANDTLAFRVIVAVFEVPGRISLPVGHGANRKHGAIPMVSASDWEGARVESSRSSLAATK